MTSIKGVALSLHWGHINFGGLGQILFHIAHCHSMVQHCHTLLVVTVRILILSPKWAWHIQNVLDLIVPAITSVWSPSTGQWKQTGRTAACSSTLWFGFPWQGASIYPWWIPRDLQLSRSLSPWGETNVRC